MLVNECILDTIIYNHNIPLLLTRIIEKRNKLAKNKIIVTSPSF